MEQRGNGRTIDWVISKGVWKISHQEQTLVKLPKCYLPSQIDVTCKYSIFSACGRGWYKCPPTFGKVLKFGYMLRTKHLFGRCVELGSKPLDDSWGIVNVVLQSILSYQCFVLPTQALLFSALQYFCDALLSVWTGMSWQVVHIQPYVHIAQMRSALFRCHNLLHNRHLNGNTWAG